MGIRGGGRGGDGGVGEWKGGGEGESGWGFTLESIIKLCSIKAAYLIVFLGSESVLLKIWKSMSSKSFSG